MSVGWNDNTPIYRQLKERVVGMMLDGVLKAGDALPSVRSIAAGSCPAEAVRRRWSPPGATLGRPGRPTKTLSSQP